MPLDSQFSLSLELTRLLPLGGVVNEGGRNLLNFARELQKSGSDIVVEDDLVQIFGPNRVESRFESSFRTAVRQTHVEPLSGFLDIMLEWGAGPTVRRSLQNPRYFSTVVQLSLLASAHDLESLASALSQALRQRLDGAPSEQQNSPGYDGLLGTLQACRDQTDLFRWDLHFLAVEKTLGGSIESKRRLPFSVLRAFLHFLFAVQVFPKDRRIDIACHDGIPTIVVWAHHVLGLTVTVQGVTSFGEGAADITVDWLSRDSRTSICLLDAAAEDDAEIFRIDQNTSADSPLGAYPRSPIHGYGRICLETLIGDCPDLVLRVAHRVAAYSYAIIQQASKHPSWSSKPAWMKADCSEMSLSSSRRMFDVACFLFGGLELDMSIFKEVSEAPILGSWTSPESPDFYSPTIESQTIRPVDVFSDMRRWCTEQDTPEPNTGLERVASESAQWLMTFFVCILQSDLCSGSGQLPRLAFVPVSQSQFQLRRHCKSVGFPPSWALQDARYSVVERS